MSKDNIVETIYDIVPEYDVTKGKIDHNIDELYAVLKPEIEKLKDYDVMDGSLVPEAKNIKKSVNKVKKKVNEIKTEIKKEYLSEYKEFEDNTIKPLMKELEEAYTYINDQVNMYEFQQKEDQKQALLETYSVLYGELYDIIDFEIIFNKKWTNLSVPLKKAKEELVKVGDFVKGNIDTIYSLDREQKGAVISEYINLLREADDPMTVFAKKAIDRVDEREEENKWLESTVKEKTKESIVSIELKDAKKEDIDEVINLMETLQLNYKIKKDEV